MMSGGHLGCREADAASCTMKAGDGLKPPDRRDEEDEEDEDDEADDDEDEDDEVAAASVSWWSQK